MISRRALFAVAALVIVACKSHGAPLADADAGAPVAHRVVSLSPSTTEAVAAVGALPALVGRSRYCDYPPEVSKLPIVGGFVDPDLEAILALHPDLVVGARGPGGSSIADWLEARGVAVYFPHTASIDEIATMILGIGDRVGHPKDAAQVVAKMRARLAAVAAAVKQEPPARTLLVFGVQPVVVAGPVGFGDEIIRRAGGVNVVHTGGSYPMLDLEAIVGLDPQVVLDAAAGEEHGHQRITSDAPGWRDVRAVKDGRVVSLTDEAVLRPGPRVAEGVATVARALHPDAGL